MLHLTRCPILMMGTPAEVSQVFCSIAQCSQISAYLLTDYLGSSRSFFWWSWGYEMLSFLWYQCARSMWVCCWRAHQGTWQKWQSRVVMAWYIESYRIPRYWTHIVSYPYCNNYRSNEFDIPHYSSKWRCRHQTVLITISVINKESDGRARTGSN